MKKLFLLLLVVAFITPGAAKAVTHYKSITSKSTGVSVELSDAMGSVYTEGEAVRFTVRTDADAYVLLFDIDTEGFVHLLYPRDAESLQKFSAGVSYDVPTQVDESLLVTGKTGMEFVFAVAVPNRDAISDREIGFLIDGEKQPEHKKFRIDGDPFLAANRVAGQLVRGIRYSDDVTLAYTYFFVNEAVDYPRYLCEECYDKDKDPYEPDRPWVASEALEGHSGLSYPLAPAFEMSYDVGDNTSYESDVENAIDERVDKTTRVYVSYAPEWYHGYASDWRFGIGYSTWPRYHRGYYPYYPYYGSSFYWSIGWAWDYYCYPSYYGHYPWRGWYGHYWRHHDRHYGRGGFDVARRTMRPHRPSPTKYKANSPSSNPRRTGAFKARSSRTLTANRGTPKSLRSRSSARDYKAKTRSVYTPRQRTYGKNGAIRSRDYTGKKTIYRPRAKQVRPGKRLYQLRGTGKTYSMRGNRNPITFKSGKVRTRDSLSRSSPSFRKVRSSTHKFTGYSRDRSSSRKAKSRR